MRKLISILLVIATVLVARYYLAPDSSDLGVSPGGNIVKTKTKGDSSTVQQKVSDRGQNNTDSPENEENLPPSEPFVPNNPLVEVLSAPDQIPDEGPFPEATTYILEPVSQMNRTIQKIGGEDAGILPVASGRMFVASGDLIGGSIVFAMSAIQLHDSDATARLAEIRGTRRFNTKAFPEATFSLLSASPSRLEGVLTIKDVSQPVSFPATFIVEDDTMIMSADVTLDRTERGVEETAEGTISEFMDISFSFVFRPEE